MAKSREKFLARKMRNRGKSIKDIASDLNVSKSSVSMWCADIELSDRQIKQLHNKMVRGGYQGRLAGAKKQREGKERRIKEGFELAKLDFLEYSLRDLFILGLGLYWGEGAKKGTVRFFNSDPNAIKCMMAWFRDCLDIQESRFQMYININKIHRDRLKQIVDYWSEVTGVSVSQFRKPSLIKTKQKKVYENRSQHYGTLCVRIAKSTDLLYKIHGWIRAAEDARVAQLVRARES